MVTIWVVDQSSYLKQSLKRIDLVVAVDLAEEDAVDLAEEDEVDLVAVAGVDLAEATVVDTVVVTEAASAGKRKAQDANNITQSVYSLRAGTDCKKNLEGKCQNVFGYITRCSR
jgi:hypothetical protein